MVHASASSNRYSGSKQPHAVSVGARRVAWAVVHRSGDGRFFPARRVVCAPPETHLESAQLAQSLIMKPLLSCAAHRRLIPTAFAMLLVMNTHAATDRVLFDFQIATNTAAWQVVNDDVMGGVSTSSFRLTNGVAVFQGEVSLENSGGFASVRSLPAPHYLAGCEAFVIRVRGDGRRYKFTARTDRSFDTAIYQTVFMTKKGEWKEHRLPLKQFVPTFRGRVLSGEPALEAVKVTSVGFLIADKQDGPFRLEIAWLHASCATPRISEPHRQVAGASTHCGENDGRRGPAGQGHPYVAPLRDIWQG